jgi:hypothetical protein
MFEAVQREAVTGRDLKTGANVADVGAWLTMAKQLRKEFADYVPRHRAAGPAI